MLAMVLLEEVKEGLKSHVIVDDVVIWGPFANGVHSSKFVFHWLISKSPLPFPH